MFLSLLRLFFIALLVGCACPQKFIPNPSPPELPDCLVPEKVRVALVLGGGGAKGIAHVGVLEELEKAGIPIDLIVGCSAGSLVGALYADCPNSQWVYDIVKNMRTKEMLNINLWDARFGLSQGESIPYVLRRNLEARQFCDLKIPFVLVATDLHSGQLITIGGGDIIPAVKASCAIPLVFVPVDLYGRILVDGGVVDPVPVRVAKELGADVVIAVDLGALLPKTFPTNLFGVATRSAEITLLWQSESCVRDADVVLRPDLCDIGTFDDQNHTRIYEAGRIAAEKAMPQILEILRSKGYQDHPTEIYD